MASLVFLALTAASAPPAAPHYHLQASLALGAPDAWDYLAFDPTDRRVYVAHGTEVTVVDAARLAVIGTLGGIAGAHGIVPLPAFGKIYADASGTGTVLVYDDRTLRRLGSIPAVGDADGMIYDPAAQSVIVLGGNSAAAGFIDPVSNRLRGTLALGGTPEGAAVDGEGRLYVNIADHDEIAVVDTMRRRVLAYWPLAGCADPHGLAIDSTHTKLFASCPAGQMAVVSIASGRQVALPPIGKGTDGAVFDPLHAIALSADADGTLGMISDTGKEVGLARTEAGARTIAIDPATGRLFLVAASVRTVLAPRMPGHRPRYAFVPGTVRLLVYVP